MSPSNGGGGSIWHWKNICRNRPSGETFFLIRLQFPQSISCGWPGNNMAIWFIPCSFSTRRLVIVRSTFLIDNFIPMGGIGAIIHLGVGFRSGCCDTEFCIRVDPRSLIRFSIDVIGTVCTRVCDRFPIG